jgi:hypothetical protein
MSTKIKFLIIICILIIIYPFTLHVNNELTADDITAINSLEVGNLCTNISTYESEITCVSSIQSKIQSMGSKNCALKGSEIEPLSFIKRKHGCCFDRARFIEKALRYYGFKTRHIFLIQPYNGISFLNFLPLGQMSHATSEVKLSSGWTVIDSNEPILLSINKKSYSYSQALKIEEIKRKLSPKWFYKKDIDVIYGVYSRHGFFHGLNFPGPEFNLKELLYNF